MDNKLIICYIGSAKNFTPDNFVVLGTARKEKKDGTTNFTFYKYTSK